MDVNLASILISFKLVQPSKANGSILATQFGIVTVVNDLHCEKVECSIVLRFGIVISLSNSQPVKQSLPIFVIDDGRLIFSNLEQDAKA